MKLQNDYESEEIRIILVLCEHLQVQITNVEFTCNANAIRMFILKMTRHIILQCMINQ